MEKEAKSRGRPTKGLYKRGRIWWMDLSIDGQRIKKSTRCTNKTDAYEVYVEERAKAQREGIQKLRKAPRLERFALDYLEWAQTNKKSWRRDQGALNNLLPVLGRKTLSGISQVDIERYKRKRREEIASLKRNRLKLREQISFATINRELATLKKLFNLAIKYGRVQQNPVTGIRFEKEHPRIRCLTDEEEHRLLEACHSNLKPVILFALNTGCRQNEIATLTWENVDIVKGRVTIQAAYSKNGAMRQVPLNQTSRDILEDLKPGRKEKAEGSVFINSTGKPYKAEGIRTSFKRAASRASITGLRFHDLRHSFATRLGMDCKVHPVILKELLGHKNLEMTFRYTHPSGHHLEGAVRLLDSRTEKKRYKNGTVKEKELHRIA